MAARVLKGEKKASELNFETITTPGFYVNNKVAENLEITVPTDLSDNAVEAFDEIHRASKRRHFLNLYRNHIRTRSYLWNFITWTLHYI